MNSKVLKNLGASIRTKLLNISKKSNTDYNYIIIQFAQERFLYRLSKSKYVDNFVLKGALFLYSSSKSKFRQTKDIDFLGKGITNEENNLKNITKEIIKVKYEDGIIYKSEDITTEKITEEKEYKGIRISLPFTLDTITSVLTIDIGFGDVSHKKPELMDYPTLLEMGSPQINAYSVETVIAEKFESIVKLNFQTSRMKDFYDIVFIADNYKLKNFDLLNSIQKTFNQRNTSIDKRIIIYSDEFKNDGTKQRQWKGFLKRIKSERSEDFINIIDKLESFIEPIFEKPEKDLFWRKSNWNWEESKK